MLGNAVFQRSSATLNVGTVTAQSTKDITIPVASAKFNANPALCDAVIMNPKVANPAGVSLVECFVSAAGVVTARFMNATVADVVVGAAVVYKIGLVKATGSI